MSEHAIDTCPTCRAVLYGEGVVPEMLPQLKGVSFGRLLKHAFAQTEKDGPPWVHTFTFPLDPDEDDWTYTPSG